MANDIAMGCPLDVLNSTLTPAQGSTSKSTSGVGKSTPAGTFQVDIDYAKLNHSGPNDGQMMTLNQSNPNETGKVKAKGY